MKKTVLYLIDSGIDITKQNIKKIAFECKGTNHTIDFLPEAGGAVHAHGNRIYGIIADNIERDMPIYSIRILDAELRAHYLQLLCALEWIIKKGQRGIINLSLGVMNDKYQEELQYLLRKALKKQIFTICAASTQPSLPVSLEEVISVADGRMFRENHITAKHCRTIDYVVEIDETRYPFIPESASSYAAPFVTARALVLMQNNHIRSLVDLKLKLNKYFMRWE
jgi:hypothetical protein